MDCHEHERLFEKYFDREITSLEYKALRSHLGRCSRCRESFLDHLLTMDFLSAMPMEEPSQQLSGKIMESIPSPKRRPEWRHWAMGVAACVMLALSLTAIDRWTTSHNAQATLTTSGGKVPVTVEGGRMVLPRGTVFRGNITVKGDLIILGKVYGTVRADRVIQARPGPADPLEQLWNGLHHMFESHPNRDR